MEDRRLRVCTVPNPIVWHTAEAMFTSRQIGLFFDLECAASGPAMDLQPTTLNELNYNHHDRDDQQDMYESAHRI